MAHDLQIDELLEIFDEYELEIIKTYKGSLLVGAYGNDASQWVAIQNARMADVDRKLNYIAFLYNTEIKKKTEKTIREIYLESEKKEIERMAEKLSLPVVYDKNRIILGEMNYRTMANTLSAINNDLTQASVSLFRQAKDDYRQIIQQSAILKQTGRKTLYECIDIAQSDFLKEGLAHITYANGSNVNIRSYAEMALRTNSQRAMIAGQGSARDRLGIHTVKVSAHGLTCPNCAPWQGVILIDDVYSNGQPDGEHALLSQAVQAGLLHPNCRHNLMTIDTEIDGNNTEPYKYTEEDKKRYEDEQTQRALEREIRRAKREAAGYLSKNNVAQANAEVEQAENNLKAFLKGKNYLKRQEEREEI